MQNHILKAWVGQLRSQLCIKLLFDYLKHMDLENMSDPRHLNLAVSQMQSGMGLVYLSNPRRLSLAVSQIQGTWVWHTCQT
jgi:hypothetical protein